ncbi:MAG TPA: alpha-amylase family glycosyl hydrolase [Saprospiraceae bacterium]|nr:alpha-amylase family glycosyl hydrolase [Saprospiraceae bacterium]
MIVYEVFLQSYHDSNKDGIGDIPGLISKLDYIHELGATAIWITPVHPSPSYHKYDVSDYFGIHPDYGTMADMDRLIKEVHDRGMKLILDFVVNHTSWQHPWFVASGSSPDNPFRNYYVWKDCDVVQDEINKKTTTFDSDNITQWHKWNDEKECYYGFFWKGMPDLNFDNPVVRKEVYKIGKFWLDKGIDGFRLDAARHIFPDDRFDDTRLFWEEFRSEMEAVKPDVMIVGEVWSDPVQLTTLFKGLPSLFNFELTKSIPDAINEGNPKRFIDSYSHIDSVYRASKVPFKDAVLLSNHDMNRIRSRLGGDMAKAKLAASLLMTLPGTPYIYYGEEIGMLGMKPDENNREPFLWGEETVQDTDWMKPIYSIVPDVTPLQAQMDDPNSIYNYYKKWIKLRNEHPEISDSKLEFLKPASPNVLAYTLSGTTEILMVIHNLSGQVSMVSLPEHSKIISDENLIITDNKVNVDPYTTILILPPSPEEK